MSVARDDSGACAGEATAAVAMKKVVVAVAVAVTTALATMYGGRVAVAVSP